MKTIIATTAHGVASRTWPDRWGNTQRTPGDRNEVPETHDAIIAHLGAIEDAVAAAPREAWKEGETGLSLALDLGDGLEVVVTAETERDL